MLARPPRDLAGLAIRPAVAVLLAPIPLVEEPLIVPLELVVENDAPNPATLVSQAFVGALISTIDFRVVRQLTGLPDAGVECLAGLPAAVVALVAVGLEELAPAVGQGNGAVVGTERRRANQPFVLQMLEGSSRALRVVSEVVEIAFDNDAERADGRQRAALGAVDFVDAVALADRPTLVTARQVEVLREYVARITIAKIMGVPAAAASSIAIARIFTILVAFPAWVVPVQHVADSIRAVIRYACLVRYVKYHIDTLQARMQNVSRGTTQDNLSLEKLLGFDFLIPPLQVQRRIAGVLGAYDDLIENNRRRSQILEDMARALYRDWFVDFRFPGSEHGVISMAAQATVPNGWRFVKLDAVALVNRAQINMKAPPERVLYIDIASVGPGTVREVTSFAFEDAPDRARRVVQHGDILWSCVRPNRRSHVLLLNPEPETVASTGFAVLTATKVPYTFLYQATTTDEFVGYLANHATGAAYPAVTGRTFQDAEILVPPEPLLSRFAELTVPQAELIGVLQRQNVNLRQTRDLLIPRLLSGQLSLAEIEDNPALATESAAARR